MSVTGPMVAAGPVMPTEHDTDVGGPQEKRLKTGAGSGHLSAFEGYTDCKAAEGGLKLLTAKSSSSGSMSGHVS